MRSPGETCWAAAASARWVSTGATSCPVMRVWPRYGAALRPAAGNADEHLADREAGHALGRVDGEPDGLLGFADVDHDPCPDAARGLMAETQNRELGARVVADRRMPGNHWLGDQAADLGAADIDGRDDGLGRPALAGGLRPSPPASRLGN